MSLMHNLLHCLGWNNGTVVVATDAQDRVWTGFKCNVCGRVSGITPASPDDKGVPPPPPEQFT